MKILVLLLVLCGTCYADNNRSGAADVRESYVNFSGVSINATNVLTAAGGAADQNSDGFDVSNTHQHSISYQWEGADAAASFTLTFQHFTKWGTWNGFNPAITVTCAGLSGAYTKPISFPVSGTMRAVRSADATHITTLNALTINKY